MLYCREGALGWEWMEVKNIRPEVMPPMKIRTVDHEAWQERGFRVPRTMANEVCEMLEDRIKAGIMERSDGPYRNPWFLVKKKNGKYRLIIGAMKMNSVTLRDANMPPDADEFAEDFAGCKVVTLMDLFSGYDQILLDPTSRDITAIQTPKGLLRMTRLVQGATNSVAQFVRVMETILHDEVPKTTRVFLDDIGVKGAKDDYGEKESEACPGCRKYVVEHLLAVDKVLYLLELAGATISIPKTEFCQKGCVAVGWLCDYDGRRANPAKVKAIVEWRKPRNLTDLRSFLGTAVYFRILIKDFALISAPLYEVTKGKDPKFY